MKQTAFLHATLIDGSGAEPVADSCVIIEGQTIVFAAAIDSQQNLPANAEIIDASGKYIIPGLIDSHVHYDSPRDLVQHLAWGVTSVNCMVETVELAEKLAGETSGSDIASPQVYPTAPIFTVDNGWWSAEELRFPSAVNRFPKTPVEARAQVGKIRGSHIKLMYDSMSWCRDPRPQLKKMDSAIMLAIIDEAKKRNLFTEVHAPTYDDANEALEAGIDAFAHGILDTPIDESFIRRMQSGSVHYIPTFCVFEFLADIEQFINRALDDERFRDALPAEQLKRFTGREYIEHYRKTYPNISFVQSRMNILRDNMKTLYEQGITIPMGTDMWTFPGIASHLEMEYMVKAGMSPMQAIVSSTGSGAKFLKDESTGVIAPGKRADILILNGNPLQDIRNTRTLETIIKKGVVFSHDELVERSRQ